MAEIKFNFYNIYRNYYRNINDFKKTLVIYIAPKYETFQWGYFYMDLFPKFFCNKLELYLMYEAMVGIQMDYFVYKSIRPKVRKKISLIKVYNFRNYNYKIYNLFKF